MHLWKFPPLQAEVHNASFASAATSTPDVDLSISALPARSSGELYKTIRGPNALKNLRGYEGCPAPYDKKKNDRMKAETSSWFVGVDDSPKKPPQRITMSLPAINTSAHVAFICTGEDKATVLKAVLDGDGQYPAAHVNPTYGTLRYFLDTAAAAKL